MSADKMSADKMPADKMSAEKVSGPVLDDVTFSVPRGEFVAVVGHNGSGKSTLARHLNALLLPTGGKVLVCGMDTSDDDRLFDIRRTVGLVLQNPDNQMVSSIVEEDVAFGPENLGIPPEEIRRRVDAALRDVGMTEYAGHAPHKLSGGQKQRIAIAGILAMQPDCIVLDEPTAMLDPSGRAEVISTVRRLCSEQGITVVLITHYMDEAAAADRVVVMNDGKIIMQGIPRDIFSRAEELQAAELDLPQPAALCAALRKEGIALPPGILTADECAAALSGHLDRDMAAPAATPKIHAQAEDKPTVISARGLTYTYSINTPFRKDAMLDVSADFKRGELVGIIGHTGSGKSTFVQHLNGLLKPVSGQVFVGGRDIWEQPKKIRGVRFKVGLVFQYPEHQLFESTVSADIAFGPKNMGLSEDEIQLRVRRAASDVGLRDELLDCSPFDLSGGEKRRAAIAGVLAMQPEVLILDEPTAGLDPKGRDSILDLICEYRRKYNTTVLLVSHNMEDVARIADRVMVMSKGRVAMLDRAEAIFSRGEELSRMGLSVPAVTGVFMKLRQSGFDLGDTAYTVEQATRILLPLLSAKVKGGEI